MSPPRARPWILPLLFLGLALLLTQLCAEWVNFGPQQAKRAERHEQVLERRGEAPWTYRVLVPWAAEVTSAIPAAAGFPERRALELSYLGWQLAFTWGLFVAFHRYLGHWIAAPWPLLGTLLLAALHGPSYVHYWFQPDSPLDLLLWAVGLLLALRGRWLALLPLVALGALNRETIVFLPLLVGALCWDTQPRRVLAPRVLAMLACAALPALAVRLWVGPAGWAHGTHPLGLLAANVSHPGWLLYAGAFWGLLWAAPALAWRESPPALRRVALVLVPYLALQLVFGRIREVRLLLPLAFALVPMGLLWLRARLGPEEP
jgi:hypothetical protein